jgi:hypothetical protein
VVKEGPTAAIVTTTMRHWDAENETRMLQVTLNETRDQTKEIMRATARGANAEVDFTQWHALKTWLRTSKNKIVVIPYAEALAELMPNADVRPRRDFTQILMLISALR